MSRPLRVALFGSPSFALPTLDALHGDHDLVLAVAQPDKPAGRGKRLSSPPVAQRAKALGVRLEQPAKLRKNGEFLELLESLKLDVAVTAAYGKILPQPLLEVPKYGFLNVHASLLPKYRGAAPIQWALINGEKETGVSVMQTEAGLDTGPVRHVKRLEIRPDDTALRLFDKLALLGAEAMREALGKLSSGELPCVPQEEGEATFAPLLTKGDGEIRWGDPAGAIYNRFRGVFAWPGTWTIHRGATLKVHDLTVHPGRGEAGDVLEISGDGLLVAAGEDAVRLEVVQPPNKPKMDAHSFANGYGVKVGQKLGSSLG